jgi:4-amino-4-deoxy-L-arabinose transferase-like glycosyltransferase
MQILRLRSIISASWPAILLASLILLPFLGKAHTIDDPTFLLQAEHVLKDPLHPTAFDMVFDGKAIRLSSQMVSGPVMAYLLVPSVLLGGAEWAAHLVQYALMIFAILATVSLAFRLGLEVREARIAGLLLASTPAVMAMATTSMSDVPAMAFAVVGMERFFAWREEGRWHQSFLASAGFALAALSRPHLILMLAVAALSVWSFKAALRHSRMMARWRLMAPLAAGFLLILLVAFITADPGHVKSDYLQVGLSRSNPVNWVSNVAAFFIHWVLVFPLGLLWIGMRARAASPIRNPALWLAAAVPVSLAALNRMIHWRSAVVIALALVGALVIFDIFRDSWRRRDGVQMFLGAWLLLALPASAYVHLPSKYLVGSAPAAAILLGMLYSRTGSARRFVTWTALSAGTILSLLIITADARFAAFAERVATERVAPLVAGGTRVWSNGGWGFAWYALKTGAIPLSNKPPFPSKGDVLVSTSTAPHASLDKFPDRVLIGSVHEVSKFGQIMNYSAGVGFYSNGYGFFPWTWRNGEIEYVTIWKIQ